MSLKHILLVDDEKAILQSLSEGLESFDGEFDVLTAGNGREALEIFRSGRRIDLLVTDLKMPEMDGFELLAHVKKNFPTIPVIVLTGLITPEIKEQLKAIGDCACFEKTMGIGKLWQKIIEKLRLHSAQEENKRPK
ncbi:MAG: response regulator [Nitrospiraceae bacterium]|nr:response regulator [Nitrospiraceae bacterium]